MELAGRIALVTGGARGIGRGCALEFARAGADVAFNDRGVSEDTQSLVAELNAMGRRSLFLEGDAFDHEACGTMVERAVKEFGRIDILLSNPAYSRRGPFVDLPRETFENVVRGALTGGFSMSQHVARHMIGRGGGGKIVFISSVHALVPYAGSVAYNAAKSGLNHMARTIAAELVAHRINVNVIEPGWIDTPGERETFGEAAIREAGAKLPWGRIGTPADIGRAAVFLASDNADYVTGSALRVDGGYVLRGAIE